MINEGGGGRDEALGRSEEGMPLLPDPLQAVPSPFSCRSNPRRRRGASRS